MTYTMTHLLNWDEGDVQRGGGWRPVPSTRALADDVAEDEAEDEEHGEDEDFQHQALVARQAVAAPALSPGPVQVLVFDVDVVGVGRLPARHRLACDVASGGHAGTHRHGDSTVRVGQARWDRGGETGMVGQHGESGAGTVGQGRRDRHGGTAR